MQVPLSLASHAVRETIPGEKPGTWRVAGVSVQGVSHERAKQPCQDVVEWLVLEHRWLAAAVADGAGSAAMSEIGAAIAVRAALEAVHTQVARRLETLRADAVCAILEAALQNARQAVLAEAALREIAPRELASTICLLLASPELAAAAQIGDGAVLVAEEPQHYLALTRPWPGEYLNETTFLTAQNALENAQYSVRQGPIRQAAIFSDGLQLVALKMPDALPHAPFFNPLFRFLEATPEARVMQDQLRGFLKSPRLTERADDDLTLLLASWVAE